MPPGFFRFQPLKPAEDVMPEKQTAKIGQGKPGPGRPKGLANKNTTLLKDAILLAAAQAGGDGGLVGYLVTQARENPVSFNTLLARVLPLQVTGEEGGALKVEFVTVYET
jgi:hypothetical protein